MHVSTTAKAGEFLINAGLTITADDAFLNEAMLLGEDLKTIFGKPIAMVTQSDKNQIILQKIAGLTADDYELDIRPKRKIALKVRMYHHAWSVFANQLGKNELPKLAYYGRGVNYRIPPVGLSVQNGLILANVQFPGLQISYTTDGTEPSMKSKLYTAPLAYQKGVKFKAFNETGRYSNTTNK